MMELDQNTLKMIVENNVRMEELSKKIDAFISETRCCLESHDNRIRKVEIKGSKPAEDAIKQVRDLEIRVDDIEAIQDQALGREAGVGLVAGAIAAVLSVAVSIWTGFIK